MSMMLRLTDAEYAALKKRAQLDGTSVQVAGQQAIRDFVGRSEHRDEVTLAAVLVTSRHSEALRRLSD